MENEFNFYLSSHGTTHLYKLLVDPERNPPVFNIRGVPDGVEVEIHYKLKGRQMQSVLTREDSISRARKKESTKLYTNMYSDYMIINAKGSGRRGGIINRITLMKDGKPASLDAKERVYKKVKPGIIEKPIVKDGIFYDREKKIAISVPNIEYSYEDENFSAGLLELKKLTNGDFKPLFIYEGICQMKEDYELDGTIILKKGTKIIIINDNTVEEYFNDPDDDPDEWLYIRFKKNGIINKMFLPKRYVKPKFYTSSAFDALSYGFLHSSLPGSWTQNKVSTPSVEHSKAYEDQSFLNMLFDGGKRNWDRSLYLDFPGFKNKLKSGNKYIINIYGSHCLNAEIYEKHLSFSNVIPFVLKFLAWSEIYKDQLTEGAGETVKTLESFVKPTYEGKTRSEEKERIKEATIKLKYAERALKAMVLLKNQGLGPILNNKRRRSREEKNRSSRSIRANIKKIPKKSKKLKYIETALKKIIFKKNNLHKRSIKGRLKNKRQTKRIKKRNNSKRKNK